MCYQLSLIRSYFLLSTILATLNTSTPKSKTSTKTTKKDEHKKQLRKVDDTSKAVKDVKQNVSKEIPKRISPQKPLLLKEVAGKPSAEVKKHSSKYMFKCQIVVLYSSPNIQCCTKNIKYLASCIVSQLFLCHMKHC